MQRNALRPYKGFGTIRLSENAGRSEYHGMQVNLERRFRGGLGFGVAYTLSRLHDNGDEKRDILFNAFDDSGYWGPSDNHRAHVFNVHYPFDTAGSRGTSVGTLAGVVVDPASADFGRVLTKTGERNIQLGVKLMF